MVDPNHTRLSIVWQCRLVSIARSSFYYESTGENPLTLRLMRLIDEQFLETPFFGSRQMTRWLRRQGDTVSRKRVRRLMRLLGVHGCHLHSTAAGLSLPGRRDGLGEPHGAVLAAACTRRSSAMALRRSSTATRAAHSPASTMADESQRLVPTEPAQLFFKSLVSRWVAQRASPSWLRLQYTVRGDTPVDYRVQLVTTPVHFGGERWWLVVSHQRVWPAGPQALPRASRDVLRLVPHPVPWTHICAMPPGTAHTPRAPRSAFDTQASRDARSGCTAPRSRPRRRGRPRGSERFGRGSLAP